jgi:ferredoxin-type protein NapH
VKSFEWKGKLKAFIRSRGFRYLTIGLMTLLLFAPLMLIPQLFEQSDLCGGLCMRRFFLLFPGMGWSDFSRQLQMAAVGVGLLTAILTVTFFFGRLWCGYLCPMGGVPELVSRLFHDRWKIDYRSLPQVPIRYGYFITYIVLLPAIGFSACTLCNFITLPRLFEALSGDLRGIAYLISTIGAVNLGLLVLLGFFAKLGRGYCQFLCPIGAMDGLVNRLGATLPFVRRVRVERSRCTGCRACAEVCICGAVRMVDRIAVVDQLSCMSCRECVVACEWGAIDWLHMPSHQKPKRLKKGIELAPIPVWTSVSPVKAKNRFRLSRRGTATVAVILVVLLAGFQLSDAWGGERQSDPDGCLVCHAAQGLAYRDDNGMLRNASIDSEHYFSSLHGNVPCRDCHREIREYPHQEKNGAVDCAASCHLEEPSQGEAYSHQAVADEFVESVHGKGAVDGLTGANRWDENRNDRPPSCRRCHSNTLYIPEEKRTLFKEAFDHEEAVCGNCHQGDVWQGQMGGHILRRLLGARWSPREEVAMCNDCHKDQAAMAKVERQPMPDETAKPSDAHFIHASESFDMTLHGRLIDEGNPFGVSCNGCHAPEGFRHGVRPTEDPDAAVNPQNLAKMCGTSGCHGYVENGLNKNFLLTDMHDLDWVPGVFAHQSILELLGDSNWTRTLFIVLPAAGLFLLMSLVWTLFMRGDPNALPVLGGRRFETLFLSRKKRPKQGAPKTEEMVFERLRILRSQRRWIAKLNEMRMHKRHKGDSS